MAVLLDRYYFNWFLTYRVKVEDILKVTIKEEKNTTIIYLRVNNGESYIEVNVHIIIKLKEKKIKLIMEDTKNMIIEERPIEKGLGWIRSKLIIGNEIYIRGRKNGD
ncbi:unnamed protein product [Rhizophagus irregularis]|nr:unnamed protein product [Rhizophagus irregularis]